MFRTVALGVAACFLIGSLVVALAITHDAARSTSAQEAASLSKSIEVTVFRLGNARNLWTRPVWQQHLEHANDIWGVYGFGWNWNGSLFDAFPNLPLAFSDLLVFKYDNDDDTVVDKVDVPALNAMCDIALDDENRKPGTLPVILIRDFVNQDGSKNDYLLGVTRIKNQPITKPSGDCVIMSYQAHFHSDKGPNPKPGHTLAHEFGHVRCLGHPAEHQVIHGEVIGKENLMYDFKFLDNNGDGMNDDVDGDTVPDMKGQELTWAQVQQAQNCAHNFAEEIKPPPTPKPFDPTDIAGSYDILARPPGVPAGYHCKLDLQQSSKNLTARIYCYTDIPGVPVNPQHAPGVSGDGRIGSPPPWPASNASGPPESGSQCYNSIDDDADGFPDDGCDPVYGDVNDRHTELTGALDNGQKIATLSGCFEDRDGQDPLENVFWELQFDVNSAIGTVNIYTGQPGACFASPFGTPVSADVKVVRLATKAEAYDGDGDGCPDKAELSDNEMAGGLRDPFNEYDYFNPTKDGVNRVDDILTVVNQYFVDDPPGPIDFASNTDRKAIMGGNPWNLGPPDGLQRVDDILAIVKQYFHDC